ncbi:MAG: DUF1206 domain-containing protein [Nocardioidaceae bacterium]
MTGQLQEKAARSDWLDRTARTGLTVYGVVHLIVAWLVLRLAFGDSSGSASGSGALHQLARTAVGRVTLYGVGVGFLALAAWHLVEAALGYRRETGAHRLMDRSLSAVKVLVFAAVGLNAFVLAAGASAGGSGTDGYTARLMALPLGPVMVGLLGLVVVGIAIGLAYFGLAEGFRDTMSRQGASGALGRSYVVLGVVGYVAKAVAVALIGSLFVYAAFTHEPRRSGGLDQVLHDVLQRPFGTPLLVLMATGLASYGVFCFSWARHLDR